MTGIQLVKLVLIVRRQVCESRYPSFCVTVKIVGEREFFVTAPREPHRAAVILEVEEQFLPFREMDDRCAQLLDKPVIQ